MKSSELILENIETNRRLIKKLSAKIESLLLINKSTKEQKITKPKPKKEKRKPIRAKPEKTIDELIEIVGGTLETEKCKTPKAIKTPLELFKKLELKPKEEAKEEKTIYKLNKELGSEPIKEKTIDELIADLEEDKEEARKPKPKFITPLPSK